MKLPPAPSQRQNAIQSDLIESDWIDIQALWDENNLIWQRCLATPLRLLSARHPADKLASHFSLSPATITKRFPPSLTWRFLSAEDE